MLGEEAPPSGSTIERLKAKWQVEHKEWKRQNLSSFEVVHQRASGEQGLLERSFRREVTERGHTLDRLTIANGHLGIWSALGEVHAAGHQQRCWNHKIRNVLDCFPKRLRAEAAEQLKAISYAETLVECERRRDAFIGRWRKDFPKATEISLRLG